ncbi:PadR family transcriptional regulator [Streptomyces gilvosporeus]|uniref:PadR family transcriptional regulator n=1 Tax=Streptomyces gilvosporeus TaxID=553510 RepID=A0A1V0TNA2_9ACTN|nr:PadR family transcriptional regulator [Streptomyces gilvosporeus]ARF54268.1 PadR family transcriptional regulator [Streptomyces gilvosporeus]
MRRLPLIGWAVLGLLSFGGERTGYELKKWADSSLRFFYWSPAISQIYAELRRLEELGYATSRRSGPEEPRATRRYTLTEAGSEALAAWADGADDPGAPVLKHPLVLRVRLGHLAAPGTLRALVERHLARTRAERTEEWRFPRIALDWSERRYLAELELAEAMPADLDRLAGTRTACGHSYGLGASCPTARGDGTD